MRRSAGFVFGTVILRGDCVCECEVSTIGWHVGARSCWSVGGSLNNTTVAAMTPLKIWYD